MSNPNHGEECAVCGRPLYRETPGLCGTCKEFWPIERPEIGYVPAAPDRTGQGQTRHSVTQ